MNLMEMMDAGAAGRLKALVAIGYDVLLTNPNANETARALGALDLLVVQDLFLTESARAFGSVFFPACSSFEKDGTFMNAERRIQRVRAALRPAEGAKPDWQIISELARTMGHAGFAYRGPEEIWNEFRAVCAGGRGMTYARLETSGLQWPCPAEDDAGTRVLHVGTFASGERATLHCVEHQPTPERSSERFPFLLMTGRSLYQFNAGTMTGRTRNNELRPGDVLDLSPADAVALGVSDGERVRVNSEYGSAVLPARICAAIPDGQLFATFQSKDVVLNAVTGPNRDGTTGTPEYKVTAVRVERIAAGAGS
jgi:formate dehydrogenase major subunit